MADNKKIVTAAKDTKTAAAKEATTVKTEAKKEDTAITKAAEDVKAEVKKVEAKAEEKAAEVKKAAAKTVAKKKTAAKTAAKKVEEKVTAAKSKTAKMHFQYGSHEVEQEALIKRIVEKWTAESGKKESAIKTFDVYVKPEDNAAYYVINEQGSSINLF